MITCWVCKGKKFIKNPQAGKNEPCNTCKGDGIQKCSYCKLAEATHKTKRGNYLCDSQKCYGRHINLIEQMEDAGLT